MVGNGILKRVPGGGGIKSSIQSKSKHHPGPGETSRGAGRVRHSRETNHTREYSPTKKPSSPPRFRGRSLENRPCRQARGAWPAACSCATKGRTWSLMCCDNAEATMTLIPHGARPGHGAAFANACLLKRHAHRHAHLHTLAPARDAANPGHRCSSPTNGALGSQLGAIWKHLSGHLLLSPGSNPSSSHAPGPVGVRKQSSALGSDFGSMQVAFPSLISAPRNEVGCNHSLTQVGSAQSKTPRLHQGPASLLGWQPDARETCQADLAAGDSAHASSPDTMDLCEQKGRGLWQAGRAGRITAEASAGLRAQMMPCAARPSLEGERKVKGTTELWLLKGHEREQKQAEKTLTAMPGARGQARKYEPISQMGKLRQGRDI